MNAPTSSEASLVRQTLRSVALLVGACVIFVGALSLVAVLVTSRAVGGGGAKQADSHDADKTAKPLSI